MKPCQVRRAPQMRNEWRCFTGWPCFLGNVGQELQLQPTTLIWLKVWHRKNSIFHIRLFNFFWHSWNLIQAENEDIKNWFTWSVLSFWMLNLVTAALSYINSMHVTGIRWPGCLTQYMQTHRVSKLHTKHLLKKCLISATVLTPLKCCRCRRRRQGIIYHSERNFPGQLR